MSVAAALQLLDLRQRQKETVLVAMTLVMIERTRLKIRDQLELPWREKTLNGTHSLATQLRFPKPNATESLRASSISGPSASHLSGLKCDGSGNMVGSLLTNFSVMLMVVYGFGEFVCENNYASVCEIASV